MPTIARTSSSPNVPYSPKCRNLSSFGNSDAIAGAGPDENVKMSAANRSTGSQ